MLRFVMAGWCGCAFRREGTIPAWSWTERVAMTALMGMERVVRSNCVRNIGWVYDGEKTGMDSGGGMGGVGVCGRRASAEYVRHKWAC
jgi:hypothetical protein